MDGDYGLDCYNELVVRRWKVKERWQVEKRWEVERRWKVGRRWKVERAASLHNRGKTAWP